MHTTILLLLHLCGGVIHTTNAIPSLPTNWTLEARTNISTPDGTYLIDILNSSNNVHFLRARGIPFANQQRFQSPSRRKIEVSYNATSFGPSCMQAPWYEKILAVGLSKQSEDCLFLNVWAPQKPTSSKPLPILFWIYGGSFVVGSSISYNPEHLYEYRSDVIIVTTNYRLGALGWLGGQAVADSNIDNSAGNFGTQDTRAALQWVHRNIAAFGGDPKRITIYGESAGSSMVAVHLISPRSANLFQNAVMESGPFDNFTVQADPEASFWAFSTVAKCGTKNNTKKEEALKCLKTLPIKSPNWPNPGWNTTHSLLTAIANTSAGGWFSPCIDGIELEYEPEIYAKNGHINPTSGIILGTNLNEGRYLMPLADPVPNAPVSSIDDLKAWLSWQLPYSNFVEEILNEYQIELKTLGPWRTSSKIYTESQYLCPTERSAQWLIDSGTVENNNVFSYRLGYESSVAALNERFEWWVRWCFLKNFKLKNCKNESLYNTGVGHGADVPLVWYDNGLNTKDKIVANQFLDYWQNFASTSNPNDSDDITRSTNNVLTKTMTNWHKFEQNYSTLEIGIESKNLINAGGDRCKFWREHHPL
jgi:carboxylesterase type B